jgi:malonyl-CoA decarboxylase
MNWIEDLKRSAASLLNAKPKPMSVTGLIKACELLASPRGDASAASIANEVLNSYALLPDEQKKLFLASLADRFGPDKSRLEAAIQKYNQVGDSRSIAELHAASEPKLQQLIRRLNLATNGTAALVHMRQDGFRFAKEIPDFQALDADFAHVFSSWFNAGFLSLRTIEWTSPANILQKLIDYEAVHAMKDFEDLRPRLEPQDRRCYAFFHPQMPDEPLIFVEVALMNGIPENIGQVLAAGRKPIPAASANTAVFYSISNCQDGLRGVPFGNYLIKRVVESLRRELPNLKSFVTLSPVPGLARWMAEARQAKGGLITTGEKKVLEALDQPDWHLNLDAHPGLREVMSSVTARYITQARSKSGGVVDPVARFHLGNGARLELVRFLADTSPRGLKNGLGMMVNYLYDLRYIERNHEAFSEKNQVPASGTVTRLAKPAAGFKREPLLKKRSEDDVAPADA